MVTRPAEQPEGVLVRVIPAVRRRSTPLAARSAHGCAYSACSAMCLYALRALKSVAREVQLMQELVAHYALAHPQVTWHMQHEGRRLLFAPATTCGNAWPLSLART